MLNQIQFLNGSNLQAANQLHHQHQQQQHYERMITSNSMHTGMVTVATGGAVNGQSSPSEIALGSASSSLSSSSCSSSSYSILNQDPLHHIHHNGNTLLKSSKNHNRNHHHNLYDKENDSGIEKDDSLSNGGNNTNNNGGNNTNNSIIFIRVSITDQSLQKVLKFDLDELVWMAKQRVLGTLAKEIKDGLNYGFYLPPFQGRAGKFLDDYRKLREYPLNGQIPNLEFKYKKRVYKFVKINQKELKALNVKVRKQIYNHSSN